MRGRVLACLLLIILPWSAPALAGITAYAFDDPVREGRFKALTERLRCLVCQNQSIADSNAGLAKDLKAVTYRMIREGRSDEEIVRFMVERYGDFVLYRPPFKPATALLWAGPPLLLLAAMAALVLFIRRRPAAAAGKSELTPAERQRLSELLKGSGERSQ